MGPVPCAFRGFGLDRESGRPDRLAWANLAQKVIVVEASLVPDAGVGSRSEAVSHSRVHRAGLGGADELDS